MKKYYLKLDGMDAKKILLFSLLALSLFAFKDTNVRHAKRNPFHRALNTEGDIYIIIVKSDYELKVYDKEGWYATYPVVFGSKSLEDKMMEGDRKTPEHQPADGRSAPRARNGKVRDRQRGRPGAHRAQQAVS